jgi:transposase InsO family protein
MTDNGSDYLSELFATAPQRAGARHIRTRPYTPRTNGKTEPFIQTSLRRMAYARAYSSSAERTHAMLPWILNYNPAYNAHLSMPTIEDTWLAFTS